MVNEANEDRLAKVVVLGKTGVGKTALVVRCLTRRFLPEYAPCKECSYKYKGSKDGRYLEMMIIDSDGQNTDIYRSTAAFILVYSVTSKQSLDVIESTMKKIRVSCDDPPIIIIANQIDLVQKREVSTWQGTMMAKKYSAQYFEVSVANDVDQIIEIFNNICHKIAYDPKKLKSQKLIDMFKRRGSK